MTVHDGFSFTVRPVTETNRKRVRSPVRKPRRAALLLVHGLSAVRSDAPRQRREERGDAPADRAKRSRRRPGLRRGQAGRLVFDRAARDVSAARAVAHDAARDAAGNADVDEILCFFVLRAYRGRGTAWGSGRLCPVGGRPDRRSLPLRHGGPFVYASRPFFAVPEFRISSGRRALVSGFRRLSIRYQVACSLDGYIADSDGRV